MGNPIPDSHLEDLIPGIIPGLITVSVRVPSTQKWRLNKFKEKTIYKIVAQG